MNPLETIREKMKRLKDKDPNIHVNVTISRPKIRLDNTPAQILDIYPNVFRLRDIAQDKLYTVKYSDILTGQVKIIELSGTKGA